MKIIDYFSPSNQVMKNLSYKDQKKVNVLLKGDFICLIMFFLFSVALFAIGKYLTGPLMAVICLFLLTSLIMIKKGKLVLGSYITTLGLSFACFVIAFFTSMVHDPVVSYRTVCFCVTIAVLNYMISLKPGQIILGMIFSIILLFASTFVIHFPEDFMQNPKEWISGIAINIIAILASNLILISSNKSNDEIVEHSANEHKQVAASLDKITNVLVGVKESINVGERLNDAVRNATNGVDSITGIYNDLLDETDTLAHQVTNIQNSSQIVESSSNVMANGLNDQNFSLSEVSSAITEISANISNIDRIAEKRRQGVGEVTNLLSTQDGLIRKIVSDVERVQDSSTKIASLVMTVDKIARQTNLLAMNASIEAAHAGITGKGFSVIAQEIRKLATETTNNASKISETLQINSDLVDETTMSVKAFAEANRKSADEITNTLNSIEEILRGVSEIDAGTRDIMLSINKIVDVATDNSKVIDEVVNQISVQNIDISGITNNTNQVKKRVEDINQILRTIVTAIDDVHQSATENEEVSARIADLLK